MEVDVGAALLEDEREQEAAESCSAMGSSYVSVSMTYTEERLIHYRHPKSRRLRGIHGESQEPEKGVTRSRGHFDCARWRSFTNFGLLPGGDGSNQASGRIFGVRSGAWVTLWRHRVTEK